MPERRKSSRHAELSSLFTFRTTKMSNVSTVFNSHRDRGGPGRETQNCRHFRTRPGSSRLKSVKCVNSIQQSQGSGGPGRETQNCRHFWTRPGSSRLKSAISIELLQGSGGSWSRNAKLSSLCPGFWTRLGSSRLKSVNSHRGGPGLETQNCRHFWTRPRSSCLKSVNSIQQLQGSGGSWSRNAELSSLLDSSPVFASQKCQQYSTVTGIGGVLLAKRRTVVTFGLVPGLRVSKVSTVFNSHRDRGGPGLETQNCRHFWTRLGSSRLKSVNSVQQSQGSGGSWSRNAELSSLLALPLERAEERGEERREERQERREDRGGKRERRGERGYEMEERREERGENGGEKR